MNNISDIICVYIGAHLPAVCPQKYTNIKTIYKSSQICCSTTELIPEMVIKLSKA